MDVGGLATLLRQSQEAKQAAAPPPVARASRPRVYRPGVRFRNLTVAREDWAVITMTYRASRAPYRAQMRALDPAQEYGLTVSHLTAVALSRALDHPQDWIGQVRNHSTREPVEGGTQQVGLLWPVDLSERLREVCEALEMQPDWPDTFRLTPSNLAMAGMLHELASVKDWLVQVPNDERLLRNAPAEDDFEG